jgi:hypothetical protein
MKSVYVITMWSGGRAARKWKSAQAPKRLEEGTGVSFTSLETRLPVEVIGSISVEEFESGKEEFESAIRERIPPEEEIDHTEGDDPNRNIRKLF